MGFTGENECEKTRIARIELSVSMRALGDVVQASSDWCDRMIGQRQHSLFRNRMNEGQGDQVVSG